MQLVFLTAWQQDTRDASVDVPAEALWLGQAIAHALDKAGVVGKCRIGKTVRLLSATIYADDAEETFALLAPVFLSRASTANGIVLIRYGDPGAPERQVFLTEFASAV